jgi:hypothetical protein
MPDVEDKLTPADPRDLADAVAFALRFEGRRSVHSADEYMAAIAAQRIVRHLERAGFVVLKKPPTAGHAALGRGFKDQGSWFDAWQKLRSPNEASIVSLKRG